MSSKLILTSMFVALMFSYVANADTMMTFTPTPADLWDLDHYDAYSWGIAVPFLEDEDVIAATLTFKNIRNWNSGPNTLHVRLMDSADLGVIHHRDNQAEGDFFADASGDHMPLVKYENLPSSPQTITYTFSMDDLAVLNTYADDGVIGLSFDPDCHFYNDGIELQLVTPEPGTLALLAASIPIMLLRRKR